MFNHDPEAEALDAINKLEPAKLDLVGRQVLIDAIQEQIQKVRNKLVWEIKAGLDEAEFAITKTKTEPMKDVGFHMVHAMKRWDNSFKMYSDKMNELLQKAKEIEEKEAFL